MRMKRLLYWNHHTLSGSLSEQLVLSTYYGWGSDAGAGHGVLVVAMLVTTHSAGQQSECCCNSGGGKDDDSNNLHDDNNVVGIAHDCDTNDI